jgi:hypothetical protein
MIIKISSILNNTEDRDKVEKAIKNIFPTASISLVNKNEEKYLEVELKNLEDLRKFKTLLKIRKIRAAAKAIFLKGIKGKKITFYLNKQVASVGQISFSEPIGESPLGPIKVIIENDDPYKIIDWLTSE